MDCTVIFDLDGTLADSSLLTMTALEKVCPKFNLPIPSIDAVKRTTGYATPEFYHILFPDFPREIVDRAGELIEMGEINVLPLVRDKIIFSGCREMLSYLSGKGCRLCIASTGSKEHVYSIMETADILGFFESVSCGRSDKTEMLREIIQDGDKSSIFMVGDMKKDYEAARQNGITSVGACYGYCKREISDFDFYIDLPMELLGIIERKR